MPFLTSPELESKWSSMAREELLGELRKTSSQLEGERRRSEHLAVSLRQVEEKFIIVQKQVETEEEYITNTMMKRLEQLKKEKAKIATEVEQEEELITNTLQKKLEKLTKEKVDLENRLEAEQEYIVNKLRKQLEQLSVEKNKLFREKIDLENQLEAEQEYILNRLQKQVDKLASEKKHLQKEKSDLQRTVTDLGASTEKLKHEKVLLEQQMEMEEENIVNRLQRQLESVLSSFRMLEQKLETKGLNLKELGINTGDLGAELTHAYSRSPSLSGSYDKLGSGHLLLDMHAPGSSPSASPSIMGGFLSGSRRERPLSSQSSSLHELLAK